MLTLKNADLELFLTSLSSSCFQSFHAPLTPSLLIKYNCFKRSAESSGSGITLRVTGLAGLISFSSFQRTLQNVEINLFIFFMANNVPAF